MLRNFVGHMITKIEIGVVKGMFKVFVGRPHIWWDGITDGRLPEAPPKEFGIKIRDGKVTYFRKWV
jgi:hypothetical protein